jgi:hypothetical protein
MALHNGVDGSFKYYRAIGHAAFKTTSPVGQAIELPSVMASHNRQDNVLPYKLN